MPPSLEPETNPPAERVITVTQQPREGLLSSRLRRIAFIGVLASVFLLGFIAGRHSITRGARFQQEQWAIDVATAYLNKNGISTAGCDASAYEIYNGYRVYFPPPPPPLGYARTGGDIQVIVGIDGTIVQVLRGQ